MPTSAGTASLHRWLTAVVALCALAGAALAQAPSHPGQAPPSQAAPTTSEKDRDNIVVLLDASGSMKEPLPGSGRSKMEAAKTALLTVLANVPPDANVGVLVFSGKQVPREWLLPLGPIDLPQLRKAITPIQPDGGTPLGAYIKKAGDALLERRAAQSGYGTFRLLVVTDGEAGDSKLVERYTPDVMARGIRMDVIGVDMKSDHTLAHQVHRYWRANDPTALGSALTEVFAELSARTDDTTQAEAFELIRALPDPLVPVALAALSAQHNQPIGQERPAAPPIVASAPAGVNGAAPAAAQTGPPPAPPSAPTGSPTSLPTSSPTSSSTSLIMGWCCSWPVLAVAVVLFVIVMRSFVRAKRGGTR